MYLCECEMYMLMYKLCVHTYGDVFFCVFVHMQLLKNC